MTPSTRDASAVVGMVREYARTLAETMTTSGHLAQRVEYERMGYCGWRGCSPLCIRQRQRFDAAMAWLAERGIGPDFDDPATVTPSQQIALWDAGEGVAG